LVVGEGDGRVAVGILDFRNAVEGVERTVGGAVVRGDIPGVSLGDEDAIAVVGVGDLAYFGIGAGKEMGE